MQGSNFPIRNLMMKTFANCQRAKRFSLWDKQNYFYFCLLWTKKKRANSMTLFYRILTALPESHCQYTIFAIGFWIMRKQIWCKFSAIKTWREICFSWNIFSKYSKDFLNVIRLDRIGLLDLQLFTSANFPVKK